jgi:exopolysaccharide biosynthesis protein
MTYRSILACWLLTFICWIPVSLAGEASPVTYQHLVQHDPNYSIYILSIDLTDPRVAVHVCRAGAPPADKHWLTTLLPPSEIAQRQGYQIAINGDFFDADKTRDIEGKNTGYVKGKAAAPVGPAMTDGKLWCSHATTRPIVEVDNKDHVTITDFDPDSLSSSVRQIIGGNPVIVRDGKKLSLKSRFALARHPRTAVGISKDGTKLILLVVDGRQPDISIGMTLSELADQMLHAGCYNAINLDGGGSTVMVAYDPKLHHLRILNSPSDGKERSVADALCVEVHAPMPDLSE